MTRLLRTFLFCLSSIVAACCMYGAASARPMIDTLRPWTTHPDLWVAVEDSQLVYLLLPNGDTLNAFDVASSLEFYMSYDSLCLVDYIITEFRKNRQRLRLPTWKHKSFVNAEAALLNANNATDTFRVYTGDTVSFYREFGWIDPVTRVRDTNNFYSLDTLDYSVQLVRRSDSAVIALLDSIGVLPRTTLGRPTVHGTRPLLSNVYFVVPSSLNNTNVFIRVRVSHKGSGNYWFSRGDDIVIGLSKKLEHSYWQSYLTKMGAVYAKPSRLELEQAVSEDGQLSVTYVRQESNDLEIAFLPSDRGESTTIGIYDMFGNLLYMPYMVSAAEGEQTVRHRFDQSGVYFVCLFYGGRLIKSHKISVIK